MLRVKFWDVKVLRTNEYRHICQQSKGPTQGGILVVSEDREESGTRKQKSERVRLGACETTFEERRLTRLTRG